MPQQISIVIPAFNQLDYCKQCIETVLAYTHTPYQLILVDNGSTDGVSEYFDGVPGARVIHSERNFGFAGGVNIGLRIAEGHVLLLNSDTLVPEGWLEPLERALLSADDIGMVGPMSNYVSGPQQIAGLLFESQDEINAFARDLAARNKGQLQDTTRLVGFCMLIRDKALREVGLFDERFGIGGYEDDDYGLRVMRAGYRLCIAEDAFVFHYGNRTFLGMGIVSEKFYGLLATNEKQFREKWTQQETPEARAESTSLNAQARTAACSGDLGTALRLLARAIKISPSQAANHNDLGAVLWGLGRRDKAFDCFVQAVRMNADYTEARDNLREAGEALGRMAEVEALLQGRDA
jgi:glycosyltransferase involved in cell wall biosynthesis